MDFSFFHGIVTYLHQNPHIGGLITFVVAFAESLAIIGAVIPGSVTMTAIGVLIGSGVMPVISTLIWAISGALVGDYLSYWIGAHYNERLRNMWPFRTRPHWLAVGENFFRKHGGKSVIIGRFVGPVRSAVPLIAGLMHMPPLRFIFAAIPAATLWSLVYIFPGIIVGALSLELPPNTATKFILGMLILVAFSWIIFLVIHLFFKKIASTIDNFSAKCWQYFSEHKTLHWITSLLSQTHLENPHRQFTLALGVLICSGIFIWLLISALFDIGVLFHLNQPLFDLFRSLRNNTTDNFMLAATILGDKFVLLPASLIILAWLLWQRYLWTALHWLGLTLITLVMAEFFQTFFYSARPTGILHTPIGSSFPDMHVALSVVILGFLALLIAKNSAAGRGKTSYVIATLFTAWIMLSSLYLGAYWLTDVVSGLFLGLTCLLLATISYNRRRKIYKVNASLLCLVGTGALLISWATYGALHFRSLRDDYTIYWPTITVDKEIWWTHQTRQIPLLLISRLGKPGDVLNVQWLGSLDEIKNLMAQNGWVSYSPNINLKSTVHRYTAKNKAQHLPLLPTLYQNHIPVLLLTKLDAQNRQLLFILWQSNVVFTDSDKQLWLGSIHYYIPRPDKENFGLNSDQVKQFYDKANQELINYLKDFKWQVIEIPPHHQPPIMEPLNWNGKILLIQDK